MNNYVKCFIGIYFFAVFLYHKGEYNGKNSKKPYRSKSMLTKREEESYKWQQHFMNLFTTFHTKPGITAME